MINVYLHNHKSQLTGDAILIDELRELEKVFKIRAQNYFFSPAFRRGQWDGYIRHISKGGMISTGLVPEMVAYLKKEDEEYTIIDKRDNFRDINDIKSVGDLDLRDYQDHSVQTVLNNKLDKKHRFMRGILNEATNAGKNLIAAGIHNSFSSKRCSLFLINNTVIFDQAVKELSELLGKERVGYISSKKSTEWREFNIAMVQTLGARINKDPKLRNNLAKADILFVDEADEVMGRKDAKAICELAYNAPIRIALTGTSGLSKDKNRNKELIAFFGPEIHRTSNKDLVDKGHSAVPTITICTGNNKDYNNFSSYQEAYDTLIIKNTKRHKRIWKRATRHVDKGRLPILILVRYKEHARRLLKHIPEELKYLNIVNIDGTSKNKEIVFEQFLSGKIEILMCSMIIRRGKNLPLMRVLLNAAAGDSHSNLLQIFGRGLRKKAGVKEAINIDDFYDNGKYMERHSKHRIVYYKKEGFPIKEIYRNGKNNKGKEA